MKETKRLGGRIVFMGGTDKQNEKFAEAFMKHLPQGLADAELREQKKDISEEDYESLANEQWQRDQDELEEN